MRVIRIYNSRIPKFFKAQALTWYPFIFFAKHAAWTDRITFKHEMIHIEQFRRLGFIRFLFYWFGGRIGLDDPDLEHPFEVEAYRRQYEGLTPEEEKLLLVDRTRELMRWRNV